MDEQYLKYIMGKQDLFPRSFIGNMNNVFTKSINNTTKGLDFKSSTDWLKTARSGKATMAGFDWDKHLKKEKTAQGINIGAQAIDLAGSLLTPNDHNTKANDVLNMGSEIAGAIPGPIGQGISAGLKLINFADTALGKKANEQMSSGLTSTGYNTGDNANASTKYGGLFGNKARKRSNIYTKYLDSKKFRENNISKAAEKDMNSGSFQYTLSKNNNQLRGFNNSNIIAIKKGAKLSELKNLKNQVILKAKLGTKLPEKDTNVIPAGALHARKNNMSEDFKEHVTHKGIPVISGDIINVDGTLELQKGGEVNQHAEIEKDEIIFHKKLTSKIEDLYKDFKSGNENALVKAGKLLTYEILENTDDNTGILETI